MGSRPALKRKAFERDGWQDSDGNWFATCSFGCGDTLVWSTATLDRFPLMGKDGGKYTIDNVRLACLPCNSRTMNYKLHGLSIVDRRKRHRLLMGEVQKQKAARDKVKRLNFAFNNEKNPPEPNPPMYPPGVKRLLRQNYPRAEGLDRNGIPIKDPAPPYQLGKGKYDPNTYPHS